MTPPTAAKGIEQSTLNAVAALIAGDGGPHYRTRQAIAQFFENAGIEVVDEGYGSRRRWAAEVLRTSIRIPGEFESILARLVDPQEYGDDLWVAEEVAEKLRAILDGSGLTLRVEGGEPSLEEIDLADEQLEDEGDAETFERTLVEAHRLFTTGSRAAAVGEVIRSVLEGKLKTAVDAHSFPGVYHLCFRLSLPPDGEPRLEYLLQARGDPSLRVEPDQIWDWPVLLIRFAGRTVGGRQQGITSALRHAARIFPPIRPSIRTRKPKGTNLSPEEAWDFLKQSAPRLEKAGFVVLIPSEVQEIESRARLSVQLVVDSAPRPKDARLGADAVSDFHWEIALGEDMITAQELAAISEAKRPLVRFRGRWIVFDPVRASAIADEIAGNPILSTEQVMGAALAGEAQLFGNEVAEVVVEGEVADWVARLRNASVKETEQPKGFKGQLRPYQSRGLAWLGHLEEAGIGGVLADEMGTGKTIEIIALLQRACEASPDVGSPSLVICPTSVLGNWIREIHRFAPSLPVIRQHGSDRLDVGQASDFQPHTVIVTTYGTARRDIESIKQIQWARVIVDEAQNIKNPRTQQAQAIRHIKAEGRFALTGTPVENRLEDLWSIMQFCNPGMLGSERAFRERYAAAAEKGDAEATERLRRLVRPLVLRRLKTDPELELDLPEKVVTKTFCPLTPEQATLYKAAVDEALDPIAESDGIQRRGHILALLVALKQICNHPALFLKEKSPLAGRSGKLARLTEMLEEAVESKDSALVFTQFAQMGELLSSHLKDALGIRPLFLHGGTPVRQRDELVAKFQADGGPRVFILSLKAGGIGLNLTAATRVFHYDRWWNPAVEDQATDRAHRIGQSGKVFVHSLIVSGTLEERIDHLLEYKRDLFDRVIGSGEGWLTELPTDELAELLRLSAEEIETL